MIMEVGIDDLSRGVHFSESCFIAESARERELAKLDDYFDEQWGGRYRSTINRAMISRELVSQPAKTLRIDKK